MSGGESKDKWEDYEERYKAAWHDGPVQHRKGSDHDITPTAAEMPAQPGSIGSQISQSENAALSSRIVPAGSDDVTISNSASGIGARWFNFEDRLRQRRRDVTSSCTTCSVGPASDRSSGERWPGAQSHLIWMRAIATFPPAPHAGAVLTFLMELAGWNEAIAGILV